MTRSSTEVDPLLRMPQVLALTALSRSMLYQQMRSGGFPRPVRLCGRVQAWRASTIREWIDQRPPAQLAPRPGRRGSGEAA